MMIDDIALHTCAGMFSSSLSMLSMAGLILASLFSLLRPMPTMMRSGAVSEGYSRVDGCLTYAYVYTVRRLHSYV
jgi:hypothetical protein